MWSTAYGKLRESLVKLITRFMVVFHLINTFTVCHRDGQSDWHGEDKRCRERRWWFPWLPLREQWPQDGLSQQVFQNAVHQRWEGHRVCKISVLSRSKFKFSVQEEMCIFDIPDKYLWHSESGRFERFKFTEILGSCTLVWWWGT